MRRRLLFLPVLLALLACSAAPAPAPPAASEPEPGPTHPAGATPRLGAKPQPAGPDIRGRITRIDAGASSILVEGSLESDTRYDRASVRITGDTKIVRTRGGETVPFAELEVGDLVEASFTGPVAESYPVQATAAEVVVLRSDTVDQ